MNPKPIFFYGKTEPETVLWCMCEIAAEKCGVENTVTSDKAHEMLLSAQNDAADSDVCIVNTPFGISLSFGRDCLMDATNYDSRFGDGMAREAVAHAISRCRSVEDGDNKWTPIQEKVI